MTNQISQAIKKGVQRTKQSKRLIVIAWCTNVMLALFLALPMFNQLDISIRKTIHEDELLQHMDENWFQTFRFDAQKSEVARLLDYSIFGAGPFMEHMDGILRGNVVLPLGNILCDLITKFDFHTSSISIVTLLGLFSLLINTYLAGGFIGAYTGDYPVSVGEFLIDGARYFGRFLRVSIIALLFYAVFFALCVTTIDAFVSQMTAQASSEWIPFVVYQFRNVMILAILSFSMMCVDYARIRLVLEDRYGVFGAIGLGIAFAGKYFLKTYPLYLLLCFAGFVLMVLFFFLERIVPQSNFWTILTVFFLQQFYMIGRTWVRALFFAGQTALVQILVREQ
jgi:hypothetical protein